jgi:hypothetical protein
MLINTGFFCLCFRLLYLTTSDETVAEYNSVCLNSNLNQHKTDRKHQINTKVTYGNNGLSFLIQRVFECLNMAKA